MTTKSISEYTIYKQLKISSKLIKCDIWFLRKCKKCNVIPDFIKIRCSLSNSRTKRASQKGRRVWLNQEIKYHYSRLKDTELKIYNLHLKLTKCLSSLEFERFMVFDRQVFEISNEVTKTDKQNQKQIEEDG